MRRYKDFEFNLRELAGSMGDFGTLFPLAIGFIAVNGLDPAGLFVVMGLTNIAIGLVYRLPMPLQPKKVIAVAAIAQKWPPSLIYASGFGLGLTWFILIFTGLLRKIIEVTPIFVVRGIQLALGVMLAWEGLKMMRSAPLLGLLAIAIVLTLRDNRYAPAAIVLVALGVGIVAWRGELVHSLELDITLPPLTLPRLEDVWKAMLLAGFAQIPLSITNAVIATAALIRDYFPEKAVGERKLMLNMGIMNVAASFFGGMPMCHGAGGLAGQYYFGARTGGTSILEGLIEVFIGLFLSKSIRQHNGRLPYAPGGWDDVPGGAGATQDGQGAQGLGVAHRGRHGGGLGADEHGGGLWGGAGRRLSGALPGPSGQASLCLPGATAGSGPVAPLR